MHKLNLMLIASLALSGIVVPLGKATKSLSRSGKCSRHRSSLDTDTHDDINESRESGLKLFITGETSSTCKCGKTLYTGAQDFIVRGTPVQDASKLPFVVTLNEFIPMSKRIFCGGTIISPTFILTAAHCLKFKSPLHLKVGVFSPNYENSPRVFVDIEEIIRHPKYTVYDVLNDIALIKLKNPLECTKYTRPICIDDKNIGLGQVIYIAGYGRTDTKSAISTVLREGVLKTVENQRCLSKNSFGTVGTDQTACMGDSGSSAFIVKEDRYFAVGITSAILSDTCEIGAFACYSDIAKHYSFIKEHVNDLPKL